MSWSGWDQAIISNVIGDILQVVDFQCMGLVLFHFERWLCDYKHRCWVWYLSHGWDLLTEILIAWDSTVPSEGICHSCVDDGFWLISEFLCFVILLIYRVFIAFLQIVAMLDLINVESHRDLFKEWPIGLSCLVNFTMFVFWDSLTPKLASDGNILVFLCTLKFVGNFRKICRRHRLTIEVALHSLCDIRVVSYANMSLLRDSFAACDLLIFINVKWFFLGDHTRPLCLM